MKAELIINKNFEIGEIDKRIYGSFIEHLGRAVYGGIYDPNHVTANEHGFRMDVMDFVKALDVPIVRYPGGNFVSSYHWEDGTGDKTKRPRKMDPAWKSIETNQVGIDEFQEWASQANSSVMLTVNLGTRGPEDAKNLVEYCNSDTDTYYPNLRKENGFEKPFHIKTWCLGNEMDAEWQIGQKTAEEYGHIAAEAAKLMKICDPSIELVLCGSSVTDLPTFGEWDYKVLEQAYSFVDYISLHQYYGNFDDNTSDFLGRSVHMDSYIKSIAAICDAVKSKKHAAKTINLSMDEWNIWFHSKGRETEDWQIAPPILEDIYTFEDALLVGCMLITLQNNCDRVKIACLAQLVNVIAPIMTSDTNVWVQTIFYPFMYASLNGRGTALKPVIKSPSYTTTDSLVVPYLETSVIHDKVNRTITVFAVNRSLDNNMDLSLDLGGFESAVLVEHLELFSDNLKSTNSESEETVSPKQREIVESKSSHQQVTLKKHSWNMLKYSY